MATEKIYAQIPQQPLSFTDLANINKSKDVISCVAICRLTGRDNTTNGDGIDIEIDDGVIGLLIHESDDCNSYIFNSVKDEWTKSVGVGRESVIQGTSDINTGEEFFNQFRNRILFLYDTNEIADCRHQNQQRLNNCYTVENLVTELVGSEILTPGKINQLKQNPQIFNIMTQVQLSTGEYPLLQLGFINPTTPIPELGIWTFDPANNCWERIFSLPFSSLDLDDPQANSEYLNDVKNAINGLYAHYPEESVEIIKDKKEHTHYNSLA